MVFTGDTKLSGQQCRCSALLSLHQRGCLKGVYYKYGNDDKHRNQYYWQTDSYKAIHGSIVNLIQK